MLHKTRFFDNSGNQISMAYVSRESEVPLSTLYYWMKHGWLVEPYTLDQAHDLYEERYVKGRSGQSIASSDRKELAQELEISNTQNNVALSILKAIQPHWGVISPKLDRVYPLPTTIDEIKSFPLEAFKGALAVADFTPPEELIAKNKVAARASTRTIKPQLPKYWRKIYGENKGWRTAIKNDSGHPMSRRFGPTKDLKMRRTAMDYLENDVVSALYTFARDGELGDKGMFTHVRKYPQLAIATTVFPEEYWKTLQSLQATEGINFITVMYYLLQIIETHYDLDKMFYYYLSTGTICPAANTSLTEDYNLLLSQVDGKPIKRGEFNLSDDLPDVHIYYPNITDPFDDPQDLHDAVQKLLSVPKYTTSAYDSQLAKIVTNRPTFNNEWAEAESAEVQKAEVANIKLIAAGKKPKPLPQFTADHKRYVPTDNNALDEEMARLTAMEPELIAELHNENEQEQDNENV